MIEQQRRCNRVDGHHRRLLRIGVWWNDDQFLGGNQHSLLPLSHRKGQDDAVADFHRSHPFSNRDHFAGPFVSDGRWQLGSPGIDAPDDHEVVEVDRREFHPDQRFCGLRCGRLGDLPKLYSLHGIPVLHDLGCFHRELLPQRFERAIAPILHKRGVSARSDRCRVVLLTSARRSETATARYHRRPASWLAR